MRWDKKKRIFSMVPCESLVGTLKGNGGREGLGEPVDGGIRMCLSRYEDDLGR
jgi:hypothetical protein